MPAKLAVVTLWAEDVAQTAHFYRDVIGLRWLPQHGDRPHFDLGGAVLVILKGRSVLPLDPVPARFPIVAFAVDDLDAAIHQLRTHHIPSGSVCGDDQWISMAAH